MGGTSLTGKEAVGGRMMKLVTKTADNLGLTGRDRSKWMKRVTRNVRWAQKNAKYIKGGKAGRSAGESMLHHIAPKLGTTRAKTQKGKGGPGSYSVGRSGNANRSLILNRAGRAAARTGALSLFSGAAGRQPWSFSRRATGVRAVRQQL